MTNSFDAEPRPAPPTAPNSNNRFVGCFLGFSLLFNIVAFVVLCIVCLGITSQSSDSSLTEKHFSGSRSASAKIAIIHIDGILLEGMLSYVHQQIEQVAKDDQVKAVVLRINSPGGSITASDDLYRRLVALRDGDPRLQTSPKPLIASFGSVAASGGYFIAVPAKSIFAERSTITGSVGVYIALPSVQDLAQKHGVLVQIIKAGDIKDSGSFFKTLTPAERQIWQDLVDDAYNRFLEVIEKGRPALTQAKMLERFEVTPLRPDPKAGQGGQPAPYTRYRADGGTFTALQAKQYQLIDNIGTLEDAIAEAAKVANLEGQPRAIRYLRPKTITDLLLNSRAPDTATSSLEASVLRTALTPRMWYLTPGYEASAFLSSRP